LNREVVFERVISKKGEVESVTASQKYKKAVLRE
jgi:hypothetical protein